jgi:hypothetical protein
MTTRRELLKWSAGVLAGVASQLPAGSAQAALEPEALAIVVAKSSPIVSLSQYELKRLYLGSLITDSSGQRIIAFHQAPSSPDRLRFEQRVLGMTPDELARYWIDRKIRGQGGAPKAVTPVELLQKVVSKLEHSVAYVRVANVQPDVRVITVDGRLPADSGYGLSV